jgi:quinol monooxygenase YgiN
MPSELDDSVAVRVRLVTSSGTRELARELLAALVIRLRGQAGCRIAQLLEDAQEPGDLTLLANWRSQREFERYVRSPGFYGLLTGIDLADEKPDVEIRTAAGLHGLEYLQKLRE